MDFLAKKWIKMSALLFMAAFFFMRTFAQEGGNDQMRAHITPQFYSPFSLEFAGELWYPLSNYALRNNFGGVYSVHMSVQHVFFKRLYGGIEIQDNQISQATPLTITIAVATTNLFFYNLGAKLSYYSSQTNDWFFSCSIVAGQSWMVFTRVPGSVSTPPGGFKKQALFYSPRVCESLKVNAQLRIGLEITYSSYDYAFDPKYVGITQTYTAEQTTGHTRLLGWGFNVNYLLGKPQK